MDNLKNTWLVYGICQLAILMIAILSDSFSFGYDTGFSAGLLNLVVGIILLLIGIILLIAGKKETGKAILTVSGLLLLAGIITCSIFPFRLNH